MVAAWSIGTSQRGPFKKTNNNTPGPGAYTPNQYHNNTPSKWKIGTDQTRNKSKKNDLPGPSHYKPDAAKKQTFKNFPNYPFGVKNALLNPNLNPNPGPNQYPYNDQSIRKQHPKYTFGSKPQNQDLQGKYTPSPANYDIDRDKHFYTRPSSRIGNAARPNLHNFAANTPGVGKYQVKSDNLAPKYSFGTQSRIQSAKTMGVDVPGPGSYNYMSQLNQSNAKTMGIRTQTANGFRPGKTQQFDTPGPQSYTVNVELTKRGKKGVRIGTQQRGKIEKEQIYKPSPSHYRPSTVDKKRPVTYKIGSEIRGKIIQGRDIPGPGTYQISDLIGKEGKKYPMGVKVNPKSLYPQPGPADYLQNTEPIKPRPSSCKIGTAQRQRFRGNEVPGPNTYQFKLQNESGPYISFGKERRGQQHNNDTPGPGTYLLEPKFDEVPNYLIPNQTKLYV